MPELPEVEVTRRSIACTTARRASCYGARLGKPLRWPLGMRAAAAGRRAHRRHRPARQVPVAAAAPRRRRHRRRRPAAAPGHVGFAGPAGRRARTRARTTTSTCVTDARHAAADRPAPLRRGASGRRRSPWTRRRALLSRLGAEPFDPALTPETLHARAARAPGADQGAAAGRATWSSAPATSTPARRCFGPASTRARAPTGSAGRALRAAAAATAPDAGARARTRRLDAARLPRRARRQRRVPGRGAGLRSRGPAVPALRRGTAPHRAAAALDLFLRELPAPCVKPGNAARAALSAVVSPLAGCDSHCASIPASVPVDDANLPGGPI